eukprot:CAMPEP_0198731016 /NCGR_PEP_ID=MMETSP1475-20131203/27611_1 /TAXON_ID= ORGANISM="Unidentified sp., Strain CCMP1999" /NCGR_SAMPLE_ID=MMETSP1475 /ASSEMBLY_ACC=CAM_ASM_001111 /LENGTH=163 /DNA_ID=CAMNT_0044493917 /DNA_START=80 /DNA_END=571 /DNA_ORIENTATION=-
MSTEAQQVLSIVICVLGEGDERTLAKIALTSRRFRDEVQKKLHKLFDKQGEAYGRKVQRNQLSLGGSVLSTLDATYRLRPRVSTRDLQFRDRERNSLLHYAAQRNHRPAIINLLVYGADPGETNHFGESPLDVATCVGAWDVLEILLPLCVSKPHPSHPLFAL